MSDHVYEVEVKVTNAANETTRHHFEYISPSTTPQGASEELHTAIVQQKGHSRVKDVAAADR